MKGYVCIRVTGPQVSRFMNLCVYKDILLWDINATKQGYEMKIYGKDFFLIKGIVRKTGSKIKILERYGFHFWIKQQAKRKIFMTGPFFCLFLLWFLSRFLWSVEVTGNQQLTEDMIQDFLQKQGVHYGMFLSEIPTKDIKANLRQEYDNINWVSVSIEGTKLSIRMKENDVEEVKEPIFTGGTNIIAQEDGLVESIFVRTGTAKVKEGDEVKKGDVLIEGKISIPDENGNLKREEYCEADGDIWLIYSVPINETLEWKYEKKEYSGLEEVRYYIETGEEKWGVDIRKVPFLKYDVIEERKQARLLGNIPIPITICKRIYRDYNIVDKKYTEEQGKSIINHNFNKIITSLEEKGVHIMKKDVKIISDSVLIRISGNIVIKELCELKKPLED